MFDFCVTPAYALIVGLGAVYAYLVKGSVASLAGGGISAVCLALLAYISFVYYRSGKNCKPAVFFSLVISFGLSVMMYQRYTETGTIYTAAIAGLSVLMSLYYVYNLFAIRVKRSAARRKPMQRR